MIKINGKETRAEDSMTVKQLLLRNGFPLDRVAVERNGDILPKALLDSETVKAGDVYEVVNFVGGG